MPRIIQKEEIRMVKEPPNHFIPVQRPEPEEPPNWQVIVFMVVGGVITSIFITFILAFMA